MQKLIIILLVITAVTLSTATRAESNEEPLNLKQLLAAFNWDIDKTPITTEKISDNLYVLFGVGGNIGVSIGPDGVLVVDNQFPDMISKIDSAVLFFC